MYILNTDNCKEIEGFGGDLLDKATDVFVNAMDTKKIKNIVNNNSEEKCSDNECFSNLKNIELLTETTETTETTDGTSSDGEKGNEDLSPEMGAPLNEVTTISGVTSDNSVNVDADLSVTAVSSSELTASDLDNDTVTEKEVVEIEEEEEESYFEKNKFYIILVLIILIVTFLMAK